MQTRILIENIVLTSFVVLLVLGWLTGWRYRFDLKNKLHRPHMPHIKFGGEKDKWEITATGRCSCGVPSHRVAEIKKGKVTKIVHVNVEHHDLRCTCRNPVFLFEDADIDQNLSVE